MSVPGTPAATASEGEKGLKKGALGFASNVVIGVASTAPGYSLAAVLGFVAYATYDLTNQATLKHWSTTVTIADMAWGTVLTAITAGAGAWAAKALG